MDRSLPTRFRFGPFEADLNTQELFKSGEPIRLQSKPFLFLATLLQHPGEIVTREQMSHVLWPDIYVQVNQGLNAAARKVRIALADKVDQPRYFETLGSQGYRFIHDIEILAWATPLAEQTDKPLRLVVIPFEGDPGETSLGSGLAVELAGLLGRVHPRLKVIAPSSALTFSQTAHSLSEASASLNSPYLVTGTVRRSRNKILVTAKLLDLKEETPLWETSTERGNNDIFDILHEYGNQIVRALLSDDLPQGASAPTCERTDFPNYTRFLRAQLAWNDRGHTRLNEALAGFQNVAQHDPKYSPAHAGVANSLVLLARHELIAPRQAYQAAIKAATAALQVNPELPEALVPIAWAKLALEHDWVTAARTYERVLQANPSYAFGYVGYGTLLLARGRVDEAVSAMEQAYSLDPLSPFTSISLTTSYYYARRYDEAIRQARRTVELDEHWCNAHALIGISFMAQRRHEEALQNLELARDLSNGDPIMEAHLAHAYAQIGKVSSVQPILTRLENRNGDFPNPAFHIALIRLVLGDVNAAIRWLEQACRDRFERTLFMAIDPRLDVLRGTKHFEDMCKQVREPDRRRNFEHIA